MNKPTSLLPAQVTERVYDELLTLRAVGGEPLGSDLAERLIEALPGATRAAPLAAAIARGREHLRGPAPALHAAAFPWGMLARAARARALVRDIHEQHTRPFDEDAIRAAATAALARHAREQRAPSRRRARP
jgi:hypothetical protein